MNDHPATRPARELTSEEEQDLANQAFQLDSEIQGALGEGRKQVWRLAEALYEFHSMQGWKWRSCERLEDYLGQPEIGMSRGQYFRLVQMWETTHVVHKVPAKRLETLEPRKVREVVPAIMNGRVKPEDALDDAEGLSIRDLQTKYQPKQIAQHGQDADDSTPLDAASEPIRVRCPTCDQWTTKEQLESADDG